MPAAYLIVEMKVSDPERYKEYMAAAPATIAAAGGELVRGGKSEKLEGDWQPVRLAVLKFELRAGEGLVRRRELPQRAPQARGSNRVLQHGPGRGHADR